MPLSNEQIDAALHDLGRLTPHGLPWGKKKPEPDLNRRQLALRRYNILAEKYEDQVKRRIAAIYSDPLVTHEMLSWIDHAVLINPARDVVKAIACAYERGTTRTLTREGNDMAEAEKAWTKLYREAAVDQRAAQVNEWAYGIGPTAVIPVIARGRLKLEVFPPHRYTPVFAPGDRSGEPIAIAIDLATPDKNFTAGFRGQWEPADGQPAYAVVDDTSWRYFDRAGRPTRGHEGEHSIPHGCKDEDDLPTCPATIARVDEPLDEDWWTRDRGQRLYAATIGGGVVLCRMLAVRKFQDSKLLVSRLGEGTTVENEGTIGDPAKVVVLDGEGAPSSSIEMVDFSTPIDHHLRQLNLLISQAAIGEGLPPDSVTITAPLDAGRVPSRLPQITFTDGMRQVYRSRQIRYLRPWEQARLAPKIAGLVRGSAHKLAAMIPPVAEVADAAQTEWPDVSTMGDPAARMARDEFDITHGLKSRVDLMRDLKPDLDRAQAMAELERNALENARVWEIQASRNQPADPKAQANVPIGETKSPAQANGAMGPAVRDQQQGAQGGQPG